LINAILFKNINKIFFEFLIEKKMLLFNFFLFKITKKLKKIIYLKRLHSNKLKNTKKQLENILLKNR